MRSFETMNTFTEPSTSTVRQTVSYKSGGCLPHARTNNFYRNASRHNCLRSWHCRAIRLQRRPFTCRAEERNGTETEEKPAVNESQDSKIKQTLAGLDALLGIEAQETIDKTQTEKKVNYAVCIKDVLKGSQRNLKM